MFIKPLSGINKFYRFSCRYSAVGCGCYKLADFLCAVVARDKYARRFCAAVFISRSIDALMRSDSRYNAIYQYGMLRVIYKFSIFGGKNAMGTKSERSTGFDGGFGGFGGGWMGGWQ